ncbi:hypothetical protein CLOP_g17234 [Closterium sp. NIES-67]|nr:hypothetical protein CLOP_g17234 [Closterium sp. NIES-67]
MGEIAGLFQLRWMSLASCLSTHDEMARPQCRVWVGSASGLSVKLRSVALGRCNPTRILSWLQWDGSVATPGSVLVVSLV